MNEAAELEQRVKMLEESHRALIDGNGLPGYRTVVADLYGDSRRKQSGIVDRLQILESKQDELLRTIRIVIGLLIVLLAQGAPALYNLVKGLL